MFRLIISFPCVPIKIVFYFYFKSSFILFDRYVFDVDVVDVNGAGNFNVCVIVAVVNLLPKLDKSGGGGKGCPVIECCSFLFVDNDLEFKLDIERLSSLFDDDDECEGGGKDKGWSNNGDVDDKLLKVFDVDDTGEWFDGLVALIEICWRIGFDMRLEGLRPFLKSLKKKKFFFIEKKK